METITPAASTSKHPRLRRAVLGTALAALVFGTTIGHAAPANAAGYPTPAGCAISAHAPYSYGHETYSWLQIGCTGSVGVSQVAAYQVLYRIYPDGSRAAIRSTMVNNGSKVAFALVDGGRCVAGARYQDFNEVYWKTSPNAAWSYQYGYGPITYPNCSL